MCLISRCVLILQFHCHHKGFQQVAERLQFETSEVNHPEKEEFAGASMFPVQIKGSFFLQLLKRKVFGQTLQKGVFPQSSVLFPFVLEKARLGLWSLVD